MRDLLLHIAEAGLYVPKWTDRIHQEWSRNLLLNRPDLTTEQLMRATGAMNKAFPSAIVIEYESLIPAITLPDSDDCHVLAAAIGSQSQVIVTLNLKDFPNGYLSEYGVQACHPDHFVKSMIEHSPEKVFFAFQNQVSGLKNPPMTEIDAIQKLHKTGLYQTADWLLSML